MSFVSVTENYVVRVSFIVLLTGLWRNREDSLLLMYQHSKYYLLLKIKIPKTWLKKMCQRKRLPSTIFLLLLQIKKPESKYVFWLAVALWGDLKPSSLIRITLLNFRQGIRNHPLKSSEVIRVQYPTSHFQYVKFIVKKIGTWNQTWKFKIWFYYNSGYYQYQSKTHHQ